MWKQRAAILCGCVAALALLAGCADSVGAPPQAYAPPAPAAATGAYPGGARVYAVGPTAPAAVLVMLPGPQDMLTADPQLWTALGFDVVTPSPAEMYRIAADQQGVVAQLISQARAIADSPVWVIGPNPAIEAAMAALPANGGEPVAEVVVTSMMNGNATCSERMVYSYSGNGVAPQVSVSQSGNACPPGSSFGAGGNRAVTPAAPPTKSKAPHLIEASAPTGSSSPSARVRRIADLIKSAPPG